MNQRLGPDVDMEFEIVRKEDKADFLMLLKCFCAEFPAWQDYMTAIHRDDLFERCKVSADTAAGFKSMKNVTELYSAIIVRINRDPVGLAIFFPRPHAVFGCVGFLEIMVVLPEWRGHGIGGCLLEAVKQRGEEAYNWMLLEWHCDNENKEANRFYKRRADKRAYSTYQIFNRERYKAEGFPTDD